MGATIKISYVFQNHEENARILLEANADPNIGCYADWTPLVIIVVLLSFLSHVICGVQLYEYFSKNLRITAFLE